MFTDARELEQDAAIETELCIVGAGAVGITIARALAGAPFRVTVLESGGFEFDDRTQSLYEGENVGFPAYDVDVNRLRFFGGTTNHWAGHCRPLDAKDFTRRDWIPHSGWPISRDDLRPYYDQAQGIVELPPFHYEDLQFLLDRTGEAALPTDQALLRSVVYNQSPPTRFGEVYRGDLDQASNVTVYLNANVLELEAADDLSRVERARVACIDGPHFTVTAKIFVLAMGGMEIPRLLLLSNRQAPRGLGNDHDLVGRYFLNHVVVRPFVKVLLSDPSTSLPLYHDLHEVDGGQMFSVLAVADEAMQAEQLNNFRLHIYQTTRRSPGMASLRAIGQALRRGQVPADFGQHLSAVIGDLDGTANGVYRGLFGSDLFTEEGAPPPSLEIHLVVETTPDPESRVYLTEARDLFDQNRIAVDWRVSDADLRTAHRAAEMAAEEFGRLGLGRGQGDILENPEQWPEGSESGKHHCGTTRMSADPKTGVVDADCRVHGIDNLYSSGSALFPTIGYANPTLTIVALSLRLADHLKVRLQ
jgi:choline dehydrogenase-like flavoprotein